MTYLPQTNLKQVHNLLNCQPVEKIVLNIQIVGFVFYPKLKKFIRQLISYFKYLSKFFDLLTEIATKTANLMKLANIRNE